MRRDSALTPPRPTQNLNASLRGSARQPAPASSARSGFAASAIRGYSPPVRIIGVGTRPLSGGYRISI